MIDAPVDSRQANLVIRLTLPDGTPVAVERINILDVRPVGSGAILFFKIGAPLRVMQSVRLVVRCGSEKGNPGCEGRPEADCGMGEAVSEMRGA